MDKAHNLKAELISYTRATNIRININTVTLTCSLVVLPLATSTMWKPVRPATGMKKSPATHITPILRGHVLKCTTSQKHKYTTQCHIYPKATFIHTERKVLHGSALHHILHCSQPKGYVTAECTRSSCCVWYRMKSSPKPKTPMM